ncbi:MAG TPA: CTP synthase [Erysipelothrix sp.]|nr:CTP synthase [Erysipelothrix sp.]
MAKYIFVTGGVVSGIGKGIIAASIGRIMKNRGFKVYMQKFDPYINVDPGTMSPYQHGEVFVTQDGMEADLDLGHYERFIDEELDHNADITTGWVYQNVINKERRGHYNGATVQVIPHITDEIKNKVYQAAEESGADIVITEIGGTVGDIESLPFLEAVRQVHTELDRDDVLFIHTTLIPTVPATGELKTKPTQHSFKELMSLGIKTNMIVTRSDEALTEDMKNKIALFCNVRKNAIVESRNVDNIYELPLKFQQQGLDSYILHKFGYEDVPEANMEEWEAMINRTKSLTENVKIGLVGKYVSAHDAYLSVSEALYHAGHHHNASVELVWINSEDITLENSKRILGELDGIIAPSGFGERGTTGKILTAKYARENNIPFFGIGMGMQTAMIEFARNVVGIEDATSLEFDPNTPNPLFKLFDEENSEVIGGTLRLGNCSIDLKENTLIKDLYNEETIAERHRHRYAFNNEYKEALEAKGLIISGVSPEDNVVETFEIRNHDFFIGTQFQPEFKSRPNRSHKLFNGFIEAALIYSKNKVE